MNIIFRKIKLVEKGLTRDLYLGVRVIPLSFFILFGIISCQFEAHQIEGQTHASFYQNSKPGARWWWFATEIKKEDIKSQLDWAKDNNFGGVEIAWVYPLYRYQRMYARNYNRHYPKDTTAQKWLSPEWANMVAYTKLYADSIGLYCDFTFGSAWPAAGSNIGKEHTTQIYGDTSFRQKLTFSWAFPDTQWVINHLDSNAFNQFADPIVKALEKALKGSKSAMFTDSWEIKLNATNKIWTTGFDLSFMDKMGYDIIPFMDAGLDSFPDVRYDYMMHLGDYVLDGFYRPFIRKCKEMNSWSRVQCLASPTDVMTTYALVDIPETEAMLNNPNFSRIVSSSACLSSKPLVSSESFTCMYGFPATYLRQEQIADLKMVADALFAQGVNHHFYHGMPYNPKGVDSIDFFATTYFGPGGSLSPDLPDFNAYIEQVSGIMQKGRTYSDVAVYIPYEDGIMKGAYPPEKQRVWVWGEYELRYVDPPKELEGYHPLWINRDFLEQAQWKEGKLIVGDATFSSLYIDVAYIDSRALKRILNLAKEGFPICIKNEPKEPGKRKSAQYNEMYNQLIKLNNVSNQFSKMVQHPPLIKAEKLPAYWCRVDKEGTIYIFLAQLLSKDLIYPVYSGQSFMDSSDMVHIEINFEGELFEKTIEFKPYQSVVLKITKAGHVELLDISYIPPDPLIRPRESQKMYF